MDKHQELYEQYLKLQSKEFRESILNYEKFIQSGHDLIIKINFKNGSWLRVYKNKNNQIEWY